MLHTVHISHYGLCQVSDIPLAEETQREPSQLLCKGYACRFHLIVYKTVSRIILFQMC